MVKLRLTNNQTTSKKSWKGYIFDILICNYRGLVYVKSIDAFFDRYFNIINEAIIKSDEKTNKAL